MYAYTVIYIVCICIKYQIVSYTIRAYGCAPAEHDFSLEQTRHRDAFRAKRTARPPSAHAPPGESQEKTMDDYIRKTVFGGNRSSLFQCV